MPILPKAIYRFSVIPIKIPMVYFIELEKNMPKIYMELQKSWIATIILRENNKVERITLSYIKLYYKARVIDTAWS